jgi:hypothetical protein
MRRWFDRVLHLPTVSLIFHFHQNVDGRVISPNLKSAYVIVKMRLPFVDYLYCCR